MTQKTNRISTDLRKLYKKPKVSNEDMLSDYIEGIDETYPTYKGFDRYAMQSIVRKIIKSIKVN